MLLISKLISKGRHYYHIVPLSFHFTYDVIAHADYTKN